MKKKQSTVLLALAAVLVLVFVSGLAVLLPLDAQDVLGVQAVADVGLDAREVAEVVADVLVVAVVEVIVHQIVGLVQVVGLIVLVIVIAGVLVVIAVHILARVAVIMDALDALVAEVTVLAAVKVDVIQDARVIAVELAKCV